MTSLRQTMAALVAATMIGSGAAPAVAGVADSPLPILEDGQKTLHAFSVTGVQSTTTGLGATNLETLFFCTSLEPTKEIHVAVEIFSYQGGVPVNDVGTGNGHITVAPGQTVTIATASTAAFFPDRTITGVPQLSGGAARILTTSKHVMCSVVVTDSLSKPPTSMASLQVIKARTQKGN